MMQKVRQCPESAYFQDLLLRKAFPDYYEVVRTSIVFEMIEMKLEYDTNVKKLLNDFFLIVWNSPIFNLIGTKYHRAVTTLEMVVLK
jgi:hypothetical protein